MHSTNSKAKRFVSGAVGVALALSFVVGGAIAPASAATVEELTAQINSLLGTIAALQSQLSSLSGGSGSSSVSYTFTRNLSQGMTGDDVKNLQKVLNMSADTRVAASGAGSPGNESTYFGAMTKAAVVKFQNKYASEVLTPVGLTSGTGYVGAATRAKLNSMSGGVSTVPGTTPPPAGAGLSVVAAQQPAAQLAPASSARVPFTKVTLTAGSSDVTVNSLTVTRTGPAQDVVFSGIVLLDENGLQLGVAKTLNSNHQATVGDAFVVKAGTSKTVTIAGNMASSLSSYAGQVATLTVSAVNTSAAVSGSLPITGTPQTINGTLTIGSATTYVSTFDPNTSSSQNIGTTGFRFAGIRVTAGSAEDVRVWSIRWNQSGSASASDLANIVTVVDGVQYPTTVSSDGKYYTTSFGNGIVVAKGFSKDVYVQGDIVGSGSANRTVKFDLYKTTDLYLSGETYGYGITPAAGSTSSASNSTSEFTTTTPWFDGSQITVTAGSITTVTNATSVAAQNIAVNVPNQVLGGYVADIKGESISVQSSVFTVSTSSANYTVLTNVTIVDENGSVVAGPVDQSGTTLTFTDTITYPSGKHTYTIKGKVTSSAANNATIALSTTPSSQWTNVTGQTTGNSISLSGIGALTMNTMTVKAASLAVSVSTNPASQTVIAGTVSHHFTNFQFDASQSGEDVRFSSIPLTLGGTGTVTYLTGCQLYDGATALNTGSNVVNVDAAAETYTLDNALVIPKGTVKTLSLKCNVSTSASGTYLYGITSAQIAAMSVTGVTSSNSVTPSGSTATGPTMTIGTATLVTSNDASTPGYTIAAAGTSDVVLGVIKFRASNDSINLQRIGLNLTNTASSSSADLSQVTLWAGNTQIGTAVFTGTETKATSTLAVPLTLAKDTDVAITVKGNLTSIGTSEPVTVSGHYVAVNVENNTNTYGTGVGSGTTVNATGSTTFGGVRVFKSYPTLALEGGTYGLGSTGIADGRLIRFKVTANSKGPVGLYQFSFKVASTSATVTNVGLYGYTDSSYSSTISGQGTSGQIGSTQSTIPNNSTFEIAVSSTQVTIPAGGTYYFELRGSIAGVTTGSSVVTTLEGDTAYPSLSTHMGTASTIDSDSNDSFIWAPNSTTTATTDDLDWTNGYGLSGLPSSGLIQTRSN